MKKSVIILFLLAISLTGFTQNSKINIPAKQKLEIDYADLENYTFELQNKGGVEIGVAVLSKNDEKQIRGFGLNKGGNAKVTVERNNKLVLQNNSDQNATINYTIIETVPDPIDDGRTYVSFNLRNYTLESIPLIIPGVMNPNLSPKSRSGVSLAIGQELYFKHKGKKYLLLTVDQSIEEGENVDVAALIKERKQELGLKS